LNLLTGSTGFVGGHVVEYLFQQNEISKATFRVGSHLKILDLNGVQGIETDLLDHHSLHDAMEGADTIYSMASPMPDSDKDFEKVNTAIVRNILEVAAEEGVKTLVHLGTLDVYGFGKGTVEVASRSSPTGPYQRSKLAADEVLTNSAWGKRMRVVVIRAARAFGPRDKTMAIPLLKMIEKERVVVPRGERISFTHPKDIAQAMFKCATNPSVRSGTYLVKSFDANPDELAKGLFEAVGVSPKLAHSGLLSKAQFPPYAEAQLKGSPRIELQDAWKQIGYSPAYDLLATCKEIAQWYGKERWVTENN
jgi:nucleoside-diphosphate-sugar epimerase